MIIITISSTRELPDLLASKVRFSVLLGRCRKVFSQADALDFLDECGAFQV